MCAEILEECVFRKLEDKGGGFPTIRKYLGGSPRRLARAAGLLAGGGTDFDVEAAPGGDVLGSADGGLTVAGGGLAVEGAGLAVAGGGLADVGDGLAGAGAWWGGGVAADVLGSGTEGSEGESTGSLVASSDCREEVIICISTIVLSIFLNFSYKNFSLSRTIVSFSVISFI